MSAVLRALMVLQLFSVLLAFSTLCGVEDVVSKRWQWLIAQKLVVEQGQSLAYKARLTQAVRCWLDAEKSGHSVFWSPLLSAHRDEQQGHYDGFALAQKVMAVEIALASGVEADEIASVFMGRYFVLHKH